MRRLDFGGASDRLVRNPVLAPKKWKNPPMTWKLAVTQFAIQFGQRFFAADAAF
jgi:transposase-like protein